MFLKRSGTFLSVFLLAALAWPQSVDPKLYGGLQWRELGPWRGGRSCAVSGVEGRPNEFYMGATGGGVWKSSNAGVDWVNVSDGFFNTGSVGAIGVAPSAPDTVYVGMGETEIRGNITEGDGVYKTEDGGKTWSHVGLKATEYISRIRVHPKDPNTAWVAALGPVFGKSSERGIFKTTDGGKTWRKTLYVSDIAGAVDLVFEPTHPDVMYASTWEAWRTPWSLNSGGPGSKLWKSLDGGEKWTEITGATGLPTGVWGKVGVAVSAANPDRVWALVEAEHGGIYRSEDAGKTWALIDDRRDFRQRAWYYTRIYADPTDAEKLYVLNVGMSMTPDGGKSFRGLSAPHGDNHDLWIDPQNPKRLINANDGGASVSVDGGSTWTDQDIPTAQIYHVMLDNAYPYNVLGAQQDSSTLRIPSRTRTRGIAQEQWTTTAGAESGYVTPKPNNSNVVFGGNYGGLLEWMDHLTGLSRDVSPWPDNPMGSGADVLTERFQWTFPIIFSPHDPETIYTSSQHVFRSRNMGASWERISPDLTRNDKAKQASSGGPITKDNTSVEYYGTVFTLAESPLRKNMIWTGSDDGLVQLTMDGGKKWTNVTPKAMPDFARISMVEPSPQNPDRCYVAANNYQQDDPKPYIFITEDAGRTWRQATSGIPADEWVRVVREDPIRPELLYAGTEKGVWVSWDNGRRWQRLQMNLPNTPVHDLQVKDGDIVIATHGRGFWILDDMAVLRQLSEADAARVTLFTPSPGYRVNWGGQPANGASAARNPAGGATVRYYLPSDATGLKVTVEDLNGLQVATADAPGKAGLNSVNVFLRYSGFKANQEFRMWAAGPGPITAPPGRYRVRLVGPSVDVNAELDWRKDPRSTATSAELMEQFVMARKAAALTDEIHTAVMDLRVKRTAIAEKVKADPSLAEKGDKLTAQLTEIEEILVQPRIRSGQDPLNYPIRLNNKIAALIGVLSGEYGPTQQTKDVFAELSGQARKALDKLNTLMEREVKPFLGTT
jgi:photosystem II stability/assembly factor-like uncharacterized protein